MTKTITGTFTRAILNPYATQANARPEYIAYFMFTQPQPNPNVAGTPAPLSPPYMLNGASVELGFEVTAAEYAELSPNCSVPFASGSISSAKLPVS